MTPEQEAWSRIDNERARRAAIQASVSRRVDERARMLDQAFRECSHAEHVRRLVVFLGTIGALDSEAGWGAELDGALQGALVDLAADVQAWMETLLRDASR